MAGLGFSQIFKDNYLQFWIPPGFAHGFLSLTDNVHFEYKCTDYYDSSDVFIGGKRTNKNSVFYYDHRKRTIKMLNTNQVKSIPVKKAKKNNFKPDYSFVKHGDYFVKTKRNKTQYFDEQGNLIRTIKKLGKNGFVEYRDAKGRKTGTSYLNSAGILVYNKYKRRNTLAFMISDVYFF